MKSVYCYADVECSKEERDIIYDQALETLSRKGCLCTSGYQCQAHRALSELKEPIRG